MVKTTKAQRASLFRKWCQSDRALTYKQFRKTVQPMFFCDGAVTVQWCGMWLAIEKDGYTHS